MNRFQLNFKRNVGPTSESIRQCAPKTLDDWREYCLKNVRSKEHIESLGRKLYIKITEVIQAEVEETNYRQVAGTESLSRHFYPESGSGRYLRE